MSAPESQTCGRTLGAHVCARPVTGRSHPGACVASSGHWWAQYDAGRTDMEAFPPLPIDHEPVPDMREVWV